MFIRRAFTLVLVILWLWPSEGYAQKALGPDQDISACDFYSKRIQGTEIHEAARKGDVEEVKSLIQVGRELINAKNDEGETPLYLAATNGHTEVVKELLEGGANPNAIRTDKRSPLHAALNLLCAQDSPGFLRIFEIFSSLTPDTSEHEVQTMWREFLGSESTERLKEFITRMRGWLTEGMLSGHGVERKLEIARLLIEHGALIDGQDWIGWTPLHFASFHPHQEATALLLNAGAKVGLPNELDGSNPLHFAALFGTTETLEELLKHGAQIEAENRFRATPLRLAVAMGNTAGVRVLLQRGADPNHVGMGGQPPLLFAAGLGQLSAMTLLLDNGASPLLRDDKGDTPLHAAAISGEAQAVTLLLDRDAVVDARDDEGFTAFHSAVEYGYQEAAELLMKAGADVNARTKDYRSALHMATQGGHEAIVRLLLQWNADVWAMDHNGATPLHSAAVTDRPSIARLLLEHGADVNARARRRTVLQWALATGHLDFAVMLRGYGATE